MREVKRALTSKEPPKIGLELFNHRIGKDLLPKEVEPADVILATFSLYYPMKDHAESGRDPKREMRIELLAHYLTKLKRGGVLYLEKDCLTAMLAQASDIKDQLKLRALHTKANIDRLLKDVEELCGFEMEWRRLPPATSFSYGGQPFVVQPNLSDQPRRITQTTDAYAIVRKGAKEDQKRSSDI